MKDRFWPIATLILGLATLVFFVLLGAQPAVSSVYDRAEVSGEVSKFQRAETPADIAAVFGEPADAAKVAAMDALNTVDLYGFIPAYALFLCAAAMMFGGGVRTVWVWAAIVFALIGGAADAVETWKQLQLTANIENPAVNLPIAPWHWAKYFALGLNSAAIAALCFSNKRMIMGVLALPTLPLVATAYFDISSTRAFAASLAIYWIAMLVIAGVEIFRKRV